MKHLLVLYLAGILLFSGQCTSSTSGESEEQEAGMAQDSPTDVAGQEEETETRGKEEESNTTTESPAEEPLAETLDKDLFCYTSSKVDKLVEEAEVQDDVFGKAKTLKEKDLVSLTPREQLYYAFVYPETFSQNCAMSIPFESPETKIAFYLQFPENIRFVSDRQKTVLYKNRILMEQQLMMCIEQKARLSTDFKHRISDLECYTCIPTLIEYFEKKQDYEVLTLLLSMMQYKHFEPYEKSGLTEQANKNMQKNNTDPYLERTPENIQKIIELATAFYESKKNNG